MSTEVGLGAAANTGKLYQVVYAVTAAEAGGWEKRFGCVGQNRILPRGTSRQNTRQKYMFIVHECSIRRESGGPAIKSDRRRGAVKDVWNYVSVIRKVLGCTKIQLSSSDKG